MSGLDLELKKFDISKIEDDAVMAFIGRRRTGKSVIVKDILYHKRHIPFGTVISGTEEANRYYSNFIPKTYIFHEYNGKIIDNVLRRQKNLMKKINSNDTRYKTVDPRLFLVLDDCLFDDSWTREKCMRSIFMNGRHYKIMFFVTMQYPLGIPPALRTNIDYTFVLREPYYSNRKKIFEQYAGCFPNFQIFCDVMNSLKLYECLVISNNSESNRLEDQVFWFKADMRGEFKCGSRQFWQYHEDNYDSDNEEKKFDITKLNVKRKYGTINISKVDI